MQGEFVCGAGQPLGAARFHVDDDSGPASCTTLPVIVAACGDDEGAVVGAVVGTPVGALVGALGVSDAVEPPPPPPQAARNTLARSTRVIEKNLRFIARYLN